MSNVALRRTPIYCRHTYPSLFSPSSLHSSSNLPSFSFPFLPIPLFFLFLHSFFSLPPKQGILAHVDHGKTTIADGLLASNGIISQRMSGQVSIGTAFRDLARVEDNNYNIYLLTVIVPTLSRPPPFVHVHLRRDTADAIPRRSAG